MDVNWASEACDRRYDPESGALIVQLTSAAAHSINIYCEQPYSSSDGNRLAILRSRDFSFEEGWMLLVADIQRKYVALVEPSGVTGVCNAAWSGILHYTMADGRLFRVSLETLGKQYVPLDFDPELAGRSSSVSPDQRFVVCRRVLPGPMPAITRLDLQERELKVIFQHPEIVNPHVQFEPVTGKDILVQHNRGSKLSPKGFVTKVAGERGTTHFLMDRDGGNFRPLPVGEPYTASSTGHSNFVADTGRIAVTTSWNGEDWSLDRRFPEGNLFTIAPRDDEPRVFAAPEHRFIHLNVSRCGRYFVADSIPESLYHKDGLLRSASIVIGDLRTEKYRTLVKDSMASGGGGQHNHVHPYLTADNRHVIYNANPYYGATQVFAAAIPEGFLDSLC
jgi:hypothetical protein